MRRLSSKAVEVETIELADALDIALTALLNQRLAILCGAGLSMSPPSCLPSAAHLASKAKLKYDAEYGAFREPLSSDIEEQATFFLRRGELQTVYLHSLIDLNAFSSEPNDGHKAIADLLLTGGIQTALSTNVDTLIETAGQSLYGQIGTGFELDRIVALTPQTSPLLKLHGCWGTNPESTIWTREQLAVDPYRQRIAELTPWVSTRLADRDLIIIGFWTDWSYLNDVLQNTLGASRPSKVVVVDLSSNEILAAKARGLTALGERAVSRFVHLQARGDVFLKALRIAFSQSYLRQILSNGSAPYLTIYGEEPEQALLSPLDIGAQELWQMRRDLQGCAPNARASQITPDNIPFLGATILALRRRGAIAQGSFWQLDAQTIRVLSTPADFLSAAKRRYMNDHAPAAAANMIIAVGSEDDGLATDIVRPSGNGTIVRGNESRWMTRLKAFEELALQ